MERLLDMGLVRSIGMSNIDDYKTGTDITALQDQTDCIGSGDESDISAAETF